jgi:predicted 3-demethylubiquinone-9 3-methyltransferase (glyoxalase superfamily)
MNKIIPCLWFDDAAEAAVNFYSRVFPNARVGRIARYGEAGHDIHGRPAGSAMTVELDIDGYQLVGLNGGPKFRPTPAISFFVMLESEPELDQAWAALAEGGSVLMPLDAYPWSARYGWLTDRWGVSWQLALGTLDDVGGQRVVPSLMFVGPQQGRAEAALELYSSVFRDSRVEGIARHDGSGADPTGTVQHAQFYLGGETFMVMDSALPHDFNFNEAVSLMVSCASQEEIDRVWQALAAIPAAEQCGWLKDRFGVSWQVVPRQLADWMTDPDPTRTERVMAAALDMKKVDVAALERAYRG